MRHNVNPGCNARKFVEHKYYEKLEAENADLKRQLAETQKDNERAVLQAQDALLQLAEAHDLVVAASRDCNATALERNKLRRQLAEAQATLRTTCAAEAIEDPGCPMLDGG